MPLVLSRRSRTTMVQACLRHPQTAVVSNHTRTSRTGMMVAPMRKSARSRDPQCTVSQQQTLSRGRRYTMSHQQTRTSRRPHRRSRGRPSIVIQEQILIPQRPRLLIKRMACSPVVAQISGMMRATARPLRSTRMMAATVTTTDGAKVMAEAANRRAVPSGHASNRQGA